MLRRTGYWKLVTDNYPNNRILMNCKAFAVALLVFAAACSKSEPPPPAAATPAAAPASASSKGPAITTMPKFDSAPILDRIKAMSAD